MSFDKNQSKFFNSNQRKKNLKYRWLFIIGLVKQATRFKHFHKKNNFDATKSKFNSFNNKEILFVKEDIYFTTKIKPYNNYFMNLSFNKSSLVSTRYTPITRHKGNKLLKI